MTFWRLYYHLIWATHRREPLLRPEMEKRLFAYMVAKAAELEVFTYAINGWFDHVHLVVAIPPKIAVAEVVKLVKGASAYDVNHTYNLDYEFGWQRGYGALSIGESQRPIAEAYVRNQKQHHAQQTTNTWLEKITVPDDGPTDPGLQSDPAPGTIHETRTEYIIDATFPF
jgi:putative transposase